MNILTGPRRPIPVNYANYALWTHGSRVLNDFLMRFPSHKDFCPQRDASIQRTETNDQWPINPITWPHSIMNFQHVIRIPLYNCQPMMDHQHPPNLTMTMQRFKAFELATTCGMEATWHLATLQQGSIDVQMLRELVLRNQKNHWFDHDDQGIPRKGWRFWWGYGKNDDVTILIHKLVSKVNWYVLDWMAMTDIKKGITNSGYHFMRKWANATCDCDSSHISGCGCHDAVCCDCMAHVPALPLDKVVSSVHTWRTVIA